MENGPSFVFGAFVLGLGFDQETVERQEDHWERTLLFGLAFIQDSFEQVEKKAWDIDKNEGEVWFGEPGVGFAMGFVGEGGG